MTNFQSVQTNDLTLGDRAYGSITGMRWMEGRGAHYVFRLKAKAFNLYQRNEKGHYVRFGLTEKLNDWEEGKTLCFSAFYKQGKTCFPVRVCAGGKSAEAIEKGNKRIKASNSGEKRGKVTELQSVYTKFIARHESAGGNRSRTNSGALPHEMANRACFQTSQVHSGL